MRSEVGPGESFYRGDVLNHMPGAVELTRETAIQDYILKGWMPDKAFIGPDTTIVAFGSCFAANIGNHLHNLGYNILTARNGGAYVQMIADGLVNVFAICQQFEWAWENRIPSVELWHGWRAERYGYDEEVRLATKALFDKADVFILTFGLSEIWYDEPTGGTFWRAIPKNRFDRTRHKFPCRNICRDCRAAAPDLRLDSHAPAGGDDRLYLVANRPGGEFPPSVLHLGQRSLQGGAACCDRRGASLGARSEFLLLSRVRGRAERIPDAVWR